ncbi:MAG: SIMPL domain-containing protein [Sulfuricaulis sp.]
MPLINRLLVFSFALGLATAGSAAADNNLPRYRQIHFQVESRRAVDNDRMQATLAVTAEDDKAARLADRINRTMDWALKMAKARSNIEVRSGGYLTQPVYDKDRIQRWRGTQELILQGADFTGLGELIGQLQERLRVTSIDFSVSSKRRAAVEDELIVQALDAFKRRAELVRKNLAAKGYRIVDISINTGGGQPVPIMMRAASLESASLTPPALEAGTRTLRVSVSGVIELE